MDNAQLRLRLITWYRVHARDLPWRTPETSVWAVLLSEVMSQQTPVNRVIPQWEEWVRRWPTPTQFSCATKAEVLHAWGRLGYPRRALRLLECARTIVKRHGGDVPDQVSDLLALPGLGEYTARAVACFAYGKNVPVVDTNVRRVYQRMVVGEFLAPPASKGELAKVAELLPEGENNPEGPEMSVALMELGALVCVARKPRCGQCPVQDMCAWQQAGCPEPEPEDVDKAKQRVQKFVGTDRQIRGKIMSVLRESPGFAPVTRGELEIVWPDRAQWSRALYSLIEDGLVEEPSPGFFRLPR
ncbi:A/G-specific adenine glycosylase [Corynebacterium poyangense]|uniref:Adenine DNA glycosylase n=1 Tax=Corynebacterium poyangense TaxID=2684405 RepID=A0A7H0SR39_9CORY|nr:A/G-specific adenine glycosylase [Corynebacterium poyangense]MBZ8176440.1 A/G-specific adenine glycosylase [Corynebacterium poyangense]QNQ91014.1 A/G-specific adenine glycosylase [Corynebacterium poyangense]